MAKILISILLGSVFGIIGADYLFTGSEFIFILWLIAALFLGYWNEKKRNSILNSAIYGFVLSFVFMYSTYEGYDPIVNNIPLFILVGLFGSLCGGIIGLIGWTLKKYIK